MRLALLTGTFFVLVAALCTLWDDRFQRSPGLPVWRLEDLRLSAPEVSGLRWAGTAGNPTVTLRADPQNPPVAVRYLVPGVVAVHGLHLRFRLSSRGLVRGDALWKDGRFLVEWHATSSSARWENDPVGSTCGDSDGGIQDFVAWPLHGPAVPALRLEHLGRSGEFTLSDLEIFAVEERPLWEIGSWFVAGGFLLWSAVCIRTWRGIKWWRALCAASIWLFSMQQLVIPGPWKIQRGLFSSFHIGEQQGAGKSMAAESPALLSPALSSGPQAPIGKPLEYPNPLVRVKMHLIEIRPLLHVLMLLGPTLVIACFVRSRPAAFLCVILAVATELAEYAFGYGFGWDDVGDLACDAVGILLALWLHKRLLLFTRTARLPGYIAGFLHFPSLPRQPS